MTIQEYISKYGISYTQAYNQIATGEIKAVKKGNKWDVKDTPPVQKQRGGWQVAGQDRNLRDALTAMQIKKIQQQLEEGKKKIQDEFKEEVYAIFTEAFADFRKRLLKIKMTKRDKTALEKAAEKGINRAIKLLKLNE